MSSAAVLRHQEKGASGAALRAFANIMERWRFSDEEAAQLLGRSLPHGDGVRLELELAATQLERISYVLGIFRALAILFPNEAQADAWLERTMPMFDDRSPKEVMLGHPQTGLRSVRRYLDHVRGGGS